MQPKAMLGGLKRHKRDNPDDDERVERSRVDSLPWDQGVQGEIRPSASPDPDRSAAQQRGCAYCIPPEKDSDRVDAPPNRDPDCLIKILGTNELRQVSLTLRRAGIEGHTFTSGCPLANGGRFTACPFYEDPDDLDDE